MKLLKKSLVFVVALSILAGTGWPVGVRAQVPTWEENVTIIDSQLTTAFSTAEDFTRTLYEWAKKLLTERLRRELLDMLVDQMIDYVNDGDTKVIGDWQNFLSNAGGLASQNIADQIGGVSLCDSFRNQIRGALGSTGSGGTRRGPLACTKSSFPARGGGLDEYFENLRPENSFISSYVMAKSAQLEATAQAEKAAELEGVSGGGFLSDKKGGAIVTPGSVIKDLASQAVGSEIDYVLNADSLESVISKVVNSMFSNVLDKGLAKVRNRIEEPITGTANANRYVRNRSALGRLDKQNFASSKKKLLKDIDSAIKKRRSGQAFYESGLLGHIDLVEVEVIIGALEYLQDEFFRPQRGTDLNKTGAKGICPGGGKWDKFRSIKSIRQTIIPKITSRLNALTEVFEALLIADDNNPDVNNPFATNFEELDGDDSDNLDIIGRLEVYQTQLLNTVNNSPSSTVNLNNQALLLQIETDLGNSFELEAKLFRNAIQSTIKKISKGRGLITKNQNYAGGLKRCTKHRPPAGTHSRITGTLPFSSSSTPSIPFPWE